MFLFSMGVTKGKWGTLLNALLNFRCFYERNVPVRDVFPELAEHYPEVYQSKGLHDLSDEMFEYIRKNQPDDLLNKAFATLASPLLTPRQAYEKIVRSDVELVSSDKLENRIAANSVIPYPPGIPLLISGEIPGPQISYLHSLEKWDRSFP